MEVARQITGAALAAIIVVSLAQPAKAQTIGATCVAPATAGSSALINSSSTGELLICNGSTWALAEAITTGGNLGIGTTAPAFGLTLYNQIMQVDAPGGNAQLRIDSNSTGRGEILFGNNDGASTFFALGKDSTNSELILTHGSSSSGGTDFVLTTSGAVGIGTAIPDALLTIGGNTGSALLSLKNALATGYTQMALEGSVHTYQLGVGNASESGFGVANKFYIYDANANAMRVAVDSSGNVGIGTTSPVSSLDISQKTDALALPVGTAGQRPAGTNGMVRYNTTVPQLEGYINGVWAALATSGSLSSITLGTSAGVTNPQRSGDATTGLFSPAVSTLAVATAGTERVRIDSSGNLGIGTTSPANQLTIAGSVSPQMSIVNTGASGKTAYLFAGSSGVGFGVGANSQVLVVNDGSPNNTISTQSDGRTIFGGSIRVPNALAYQALNAAGNANLVLASADSSNNYDYADSKLVVLNTGNVGIGTTSPGGPLNIAGGQSNTIGSDSLLLTDSANATRQVGIRMTADGNPGADMAFDIEASSVWSEAMRIRRTTGNVGIGTTAPQNRLHIYTTTNADGLSIDGSVSPAINWRASGSAVAYLGVATVAGNYVPGSAVNDLALQLNANNFLIGTGTSPLLAVQNGGNVGIGTTNPQGTLHVSTTGTAGNSQVVTVLDNQYQTATVGDSSRLLFNIYNNTTLAPQTEAYIEGITDNASAGQRGTALAFGTGSQVGNALTEKMRITNGGNVGIGTASPPSTLSINSIGGTVSATLATQAGTLGSSAGNDIGIASFGFKTGNWVNLGIHGYRVSNGSDWTTTAIGLGMDVDSTLRAGANLWLNSNGNVGIGTTAPAQLLEVNGTGRMDTGLIVPLIYPAADSTTAIQIDKANGSSNVVDIDTTNGRVGMGTTSPQATLDVNGYARLTLNSSAPVTCTTTNQGAISLNHLAQMCACNGTSWIFSDSTGAACSW